MLLPVPLILLLLFLHLILNCCVFQYGGTWNRALQQDHCLVKAVLPSLGPLAYFDSKSHQPSFQGSPRERRYPTSLTGGGKKAKTFLQFSVGTCLQHIHLALNSHSAGPSWRRYFVFLFCTTTLQARTTSTSNDKYDSKSMLGPCAHDLWHNVPRRDMSAPAASLLIPHLCSLRSHTPLQLSSFTVK